MDYEEKYKEALKGIRELVNANCDMIRIKRLKRRLEYYFPELAESEDEKIKKEIIAIFKGEIPYTSEEDAKRYIAWLEKQGGQEPASVTDEWIEDYWQHEKVNNPYSYDKGEEIQFDHQSFVRFCKKYCKKPADKVEPKFKVGDWITFYGGEPFKILKVEPEQNGILDYLLLGQNGHDSYYNKKYVDENARLWTIQDAKDGDVLVDSYSKDSIIILYKGIYKERSISAHCGWNGYNLSVPSNDGLGYGGLDNTDYLPATKEQRDLLFQKMKEAGYEWDRKLIKMEV